MMLDIAISSVNKWSQRKRGVIISANYPEGGVIQRILARPLIETRAIDYTPIGSMDRAN